MRKASLTIGIALAISVLVSPIQRAGNGAEDEMLRMLGPDRPYQAVPADLFERLGWDLLDGGAQVKALADAAPGGSFDPRKLDSLDSGKLGYRAKWYEVGYKVYGLDWGIGGLYLMPNKPVTGLPTLFPTLNAPLTGYRRMVWMAGRLDNGHWNYKEPEKAPDLNVANHFRKLDPQASIRVVVYDVPITHYGHIEKPRQLAGGMLTALKWLAEPDARN